MRYLERMEKMEAIDERVRMLMLELLSRLDGVNRETGRIVSTRPFMRLWEEISSVSGRNPAGRELWRFSPIMASPPPSVRSIARVAKYLQIR
jgi:hypothetical protein